LQNQETPNEKRRKIEQIMYVPPKITSPLGQFKMNPPTSKRFTPLQITGEQKIQGISGYKKK